MSEENKLNQDGMPGQDSDAANPQSEEVTPGQPAQPTPPESPFGVATPPPAEPGVSISGQATQPVQPPQPEQPGQAWQPQQVSSAPQTPFGQQPEQPTQQYQQQPYDAQGQIPPSPYYGQATVAAGPSAGNGKAIAALICGIGAIVFSWTFIIGIALAIVAIVLASQYVKSYGKDGKATGGKVCGIIGGIISVLFLIGYILLFVATVALIDEYENNYYSGNLPSYEYEYDSGNGSSSDSLDSYGTSADDEAVETAMMDTLDGLKDLDDKKIEELAKAYETEFESFMGYTMADAGIDSKEAVKAGLKSITYEFDGAYAYDNGTGNAYAETTSIGLMDCLYYVEEKALELGIDTSPTGDKAKVGELFKEAWEKAEPGEYYILLEFEKTGGTWEVTEESLDEELEYLLGTF